MAGVLAGVVIVAHLLPYYSFLVRLECVMKTLSLPCTALYCSRYKAGCFMCAKNCILTFQGVFKTEPRRRLDVRSLISRCLARGIGKMLLMTFKRACKGEYVCCRKFI